VTAARAIAIMALLLPLPSAAAEEGPVRRPRPSLGDPSAVIAADLALSREARDRGEAEALRRTAADQAVVLVPRPAPADQWLKGRRPSGLSIRWEPRTVWASCDGGFAATRGAWNRGSDRGDYLALWQRQPKGEWRWLLHENGPAAAPAGEPEMIAGKVAECTGLPPRPPGFVPQPAVPLGDASRDGSLEWKATVGPGCGVTIAVRAWDGRAMREVLTWNRPGPTEGCGPPPGERG
jgi:hypothetical protein